MADLSINAGEICDRVEAITQCTDAGDALKYVNEGYRRVLGGKDPRHPESDGHAWSFLRPATTITIWPTTTTGAVTVGGAGDTTLTVIADTFYASMVGRTIVADTTENSYTIESYTSATEIAVDSDASADTGDTFTITADGTYALPDDFGGLVSPFVYTYSSSESLNDLTEITPEKLDEYQRDDDDTDDPDYFTVVPRSIVSTGQRWDVIFYRTPDTVRTLRYRYQRRADALTDSASVYPLGTPKFHQAVLYAALAAAEYVTYKNPGYYALNMYPEAIEAAIDEDSGLYGSMDVPVNMSDV
jgi:hypothetical protein